MATPEEIAAERERRQLERSGATQAAAPRQTNAGAATAEAIAEERWRRRQMRQAEERDRQRGRPQPTPPRQVGGTEDVARSSVTGVHEGAASVAGFGGDLQNLNAELGGVGLYWARRAQGKSDAEARADVQANLNLAREQRRGAGIQLPTTQSVNDALLAVEPEGVREWTDHTPQTTAGEFARTVGNMAPNALFPARSVATRAARVAVPGVASEGAGQLTEGTPYEGPARVIGAIGGGLAAEAGVAANARRATRQQARPEAEALAQEFGPMTRGERSGNASLRYEEDNFRRGMGSDQAVAELRGFDARRAQTIRGNAMNLITRGQPALSENVGEAGVILGDELRSARDALRSRKTQFYDEATPLLEAEPIAPTNDRLIDAMEAAAEQRFAKIPSETREALNLFEREVLQGRANHARLEEVRKALNRDLATAMRQGNARDEFILDEMIDALDGWQANRLTNANARRAIQEARAINRELRTLYSPQNRVELSTGQTGSRDLGGAAIDRTINADLTGEQIIDSLVGVGTRPSQQALGAVRRIKELGTNRIIYTNRGAASGARVPGRRRVGGQTAGQRRFNADDPTAPRGMEQPTAELQALREGLWHRILRPLDDYLERAQVAGVNEGGMLPAQRMVSQLDHALNKGGRELMEQLYTPREMAGMRRLLQYFQTIVPPIGTSVSNTPAGIYRMISRALDKATGLIPGLGPLMREAAENMGSTDAARRAVRQPRAPNANRRPPTIEQPSPYVAPVSGMIGMATTREDERRPGQIGLIER